MTDFTVPKAQPAPPERSQCKMGLPMKMKAACVCKPGAGSQLLATSRLEARELWMRRLLQMRQRHEKAKVHQRMATAQALTLFHLACFCIRAYYGGRKKSCTTPNGMLPWTLALPI